MLGSTSKSIVFSGDSAHIGPFQQNGPTRKSQGPGGSQEKAAAGALGTVKNGSSPERGLVAIARYYLRFTDVLLEPMTRARGGRWQEGDGFQFSRQFN